MNREELKRMWFSIDHSNKVEKFTITVQMEKYHERLGQGVVTTTRDDKDGYSEFSTHQVNPFLYLSECEKFNSGKYELIIK